MFFITIQLELFLIAFSVALLHEAGHVLSALILKFKVIKINILPFGVNSEIELTGAWYKKILVIYSGPLVNLLLIMITHFSGFMNFEYFIHINVYMLIINLLPVFPLDGGRALLECFQEDGNNLFNSISLFVTIVVLILGCIFVLNGSFNFSLIIIALFLLSNFTTEHKYNTNIFSNSFGVCDALWVLDSTRLYTLSALSSENKIKIFYVINDNGELLGVLTNKHVYSALVSGRYHDEIIDLLKTGDLYEQTRKNFN